MEKEAETKTKKQNTTTAKESQLKEKAIHYALNFLTFAVTGFITGAASAVGARTTNSLFTKSSPSESLAKTPLKIAN